MGAQDFRVTATGNSAKAAFDAAKDEAFYEHGHGGYTGSIAEKGEFRIEKPPLGTSPEAYVDQCMNWENKHWALADKWGPACAVQIGPSEWIFFGSASS